MLEIWEAENPVTRQRAIHRRDADRWQWTLGPAQYQWLENTLAGSTAKYKFVFAHQVSGGMDDYGRGGAY